MKRKDRLRWIAILAAIPVLYTVILFAFGGLENLENKLLDFRYQSFNPGHEISKDIVILEIDENTLKRYKEDEVFGRWPWRRIAYLPILEFIQQGAPAMILFDITFYERSRLEDDEILGAATAAVGNLSHAVSFTREQPLEDGNDVLTVSLPKELQLLSVPFEGNIEHAGQPYNSTNYPIEELVLNMNLLHSVAFDPDSDNVARRMRPFFAYNDRLYPGLALTALRSKFPYQKIELNEDRVDLIGTEKISIPVNEGLSTIHWYSFDEVWNGMERYSIAAALESKQAIELGTIENPEDLLIKPWEFQDKIVIIGATAPATHDIKTTPYGRMPGVFLHALYLSNLLEGHFLNELPESLGLILALLLTVFCVVTVLYAKNVIVRVAVPGSIFLLYFVLNFLLFKFDVMLTLAPFVVSYPVAFLSSVGLLAFFESRDKSHFKATMGKYLSPAVLTDVISRQNLTAEVGERKVMSVMFTDIRSFTTMSEGMDATEVVAILNEYLSRMVDIVFETEGTLDKFIGDAIMAFWNAPVEQHDHPVRAVKTGLKMLEALDQLNSQWAETGRPAMHMGVGVNTGEMVVGNIGSSKRLDYTVIGDNVNLGSRLESLTKNYGVAMIVSETTAMEIRAEFLTRPLDLVAVKGKTRPVAIFEPLSADMPKRCNSLSNVEYAEQSREAFDHYRHARFNEAIALYEKLLAETGGKDVVASTMIERSKAYLVTPPPANWDGSFIMKTK